jgi:hypothetical protein
MIAPISISWPEQNGNRDSGPADVVYVHHVAENDDGSFTVFGTCPACGYGASMQWEFMRDDGVTVPRCNKCKRGSPYPERFVPISEELAKLMTPVQP